MDPPVKPEGDGGWVEVCMTSVPSAALSFAGLTGESISPQSANGAMDPPIKSAGDKRQ